LAEKSEKNICLGIFDKDLKKIAKFVNTILSTKYCIWKERNVELNNSFYTRVQNELFNSINASSS
jgi:hypothetical protein